MPVESNVSAGGWMREGAEADAAQEDVEHEQQKAEEQEGCPDALARLGMVRARVQDVGGVPNLNQPDRIHPNAAGQKILAENVWRVLEPIAREVSGEKL